MYIELSLGSKEDQEAHNGLKPIRLNLGKPKFIKT